MSRSVVWSPSRRDADSELYDFGCDLVQAAVAICRGVSNPEAAPAVPAVLGCIEAALQELSHASAALQQANAESRQMAGDPRRRAIADRMERGYTNLTVALQDAQAAGHAARSLAARTFASTAR
jgi:hypothetical protein